MSDAQDLKDKFWDTLDDSPFVMLGLAGVDEAHTQPMTAQFDDDLPDRVYFYTNRQNRLVKALTATHAGVLNFSAKGHDLFACIHGTLAIDNDRAVIEKFWSPVVSAWFEKGKDDPDLTLLRFDLGKAQIWKAGTGEFLHYMTAALLGRNADEAAKGDVVETTF
ncbi:pyridoxamine 5'-phosphate oxidase family protein [Acuticoccus sp. I52.16.1]|uniref:pyridoxamine 5'-phosphate oxidase family protein n=1 Tax=Acuticoccus sp. I52.16.1 TaxID=2928472 RepID=UPI001FD0E047|nr:pyridoxamine 5'-phosphate oxidase family protein [Acuticoccus sp. I52.16.1]UOM33426.1 pyridoxamine 5'-phosphate oxidase family protein [Acuticoccus sp. I52.16.1]